MNKTFSMVFTHRMYTVGLVMRCLALGALFLISPASPAPPPGHKPLPAAEVLNIISQNAWGWTFISIGVIAGLGLILSWLKHDFFLMKFANFFSAVVLTAYSTILLYYAMENNYITSGFALLEVILYSLAFVDFMIAISIVPDAFKDLMKRTIVLSS